MLSFPLDSHSLCLSREYVVVIHGAISSSTEFYCWIAWIFITQKTKRNNFHLIVVMPFRFQTTVSNWKPFVCTRNSVVTLHASLGKNTHKANFYVHAVLWDTLSRGQTISALCDFQESHIIPLGVIQNEMWT